MIDCDTLTAVVLGDHADPRLHDDRVQCIEGDGGNGSVVLVGVVHDHPASVARVVRLLQVVDPHTLALELPPLAMPLFRLYASEDSVPPRLGGEMSAALQAFDGRRSVGIDEPNWAYLRRLLAALRAEDVPIPVLRSVAKDFLSGVAHALACRLAAGLGRLTGVRLRLYTHLTYDVSWLDSAEAQAEHERGHVAHRQSFLRAIEVPQSIRLIDGAREDTMVTSLRRLRRHGDVVAVVGVEHVDPLLEGLQPQSA